MSNGNTARFWYHGWSVVTVCVLSQVAANGLTYNAFSLFLPGWSHELNTPVSRLQLPIAAMLLGSAFASPLIGILADRYPARPLLATGLLGMAVFYFAISGVTEAWQIIALYGLLASVVLVLSTAVVTNALISRWFVRRLGLALGLSAFGIGLAGVALPPLIAWLLPQVGWRMIWRGGGLVLAFIVMPIVVWTCRNRPTDTEGAYYLSSGDGKPARAHGHGAQGGNSLSWREVVSRRNFWLLIAIYLPMMALYGGTGQNLAPLVGARGLAPQSGGMLISVLSGSHVVANFVLGLLSDRYGNRVPFVGLALLGMAGALLLAFGSGLSPIVLGVALIGLGGGVFTLLAAAIAVEFGAEGVGRAFGLSMLFLPVSALSPFAVARTQENMGSYTPAFIALAVLALLSGMFALLLRERRSGESATAPSWQPATRETHS
jgi:OFA family oxalate/formate antiporter-like MFS transporter